MKYEGKTGGHTMKSNLNNDAAVRNLTPEDKPYYCMSDNKAEKGFGVLVYPTGSMTFVFKYKVDGAQKLLKLGTYPEEKLSYLRDEYLKAAAKVKDLRRGSADGVDPVAELKRKGERRIQAAEAEKQEYTFDQLAKAYIKDNVEGQLADKSVYDIKRVLIGTGKKDCIDDFKVWRHRKASSITTEDVSKLLKTVSDRHASSAMNIIKTCRPMFVYAVARNIAPSNPFLLSTVKTFLSKPVQNKLKPAIKSRTLKAEEIKHVWAAIPAGVGSLEAKNALRIILLTGQRPSEVLGLSAAEIKDSWWTLPKARTKARLDKNRKDHTVFLVPEALRILGTKKKKRDFTSSHRRKQSHRQSRKLSP
jgi:integrase